MFLGGWGSVWFGEGVFRKGINRCWGVGEELRSIKVGIVVEY